MVLVFQNDKFTKFASTLLKGDEAQAVARSAPENLKIKNYKVAWKKVKCHRCKIEGVLQN